MELEVDDDGDDILVEIGSEAKDGEDEMVLV